MLGAIAMNRIVDIDAKRLEQLRNYALWERENFPGGRVHILDWAANEIERLREEVRNMNNPGKPDCCEPEYQPPCPDCGSVTPVGYEHDCGD